MGYGTIPPLKVQEKLFHMDCNIGAEGTLDCYLATAPDRNQYVLAIFIGKYEEVSYRAMVEVADFAQKKEKLLPELLDTFKEFYIRDSMQEIACNTIQ